MSNQTSRKSWILRLIFAAVLILSLLSISRELALNTADAAIRAAGGEVAGLSIGLTWGKKAPGLIGWKVKFEPSDVISNRDLTIWISLTGQPISSDPESILISLREGNK
jgi:hypothetical protein